MSTHFTESDDDQASSHAAPHPAGIKHAVVLFVALIAAATATYLVPEHTFTSVGLDKERFLVFKEGSTVPFSRILDFKPVTQVGIAGVQDQNQEAIEDEAELLSAAPLPEAIEVEVPLSELNAEFRIAPEDFEGLTQTIEDPNDAMRPFYERLLRVQKDEPELLARIALYSDSINGSDRISSFLRYALQDRFGDGGKGWVPIASGWQSQRHQDVAWEPEGGWRLWVVNRGEVDDGHYGLGGVLAENRSQQSRVTFGTVEDGSAGTRASQFRLYFQRSPGAGSVSVAVDEGEAEDLSLDSDALEDGVFEVSAPDGPHEFTVRTTSGRTRLYGAALERAGPGVVVDGLMLVGAFTRVLLNYDAEHWAQQLDLRESDLVIVWLGGNDSVSESVPFRRSRFDPAFRQVLARAQAGSRPRACLVVSVLDSAERINGVIRSRPRVPRVVEAQREAALEAGCAFFNGFEAIGGAGTMARWSRSRPRLVSVDYRHLTIEGARVFSALLNKAILQDYDSFLTDPAAAETTP